MASTLAPPAPAPDRSSAALAFLQCLLADSDGIHRHSLAPLLDQFVEIMQATRAGLHLLPQMEALAVSGVRPGTGDAPLGGLPWESAPAVLERARLSASAIAVPEPGVGDGGYLLCVLRNPGTAWLFWLHDTRRAEWTPTECATWALVGSTLLRWLETASGPAWAERLDRAIRQEQMEHANAIVRRLAHDYGNIFTSLLGFSELSLAQHLPANSPLPRFLAELHRSAEEGAQLTHRLSVLSRRQTPSIRSTPPGSLLLSEEARFRRQIAPGTTFQVDMPAELPSVAIDAVQLQMVLGALLDNAREAVETAGTIRLSVRLVTLTHETCRDYYGSAQAGAYLEIQIEDDGPGLSEAALQALFRDPFYSGKNRRGGFGLATAYGILAAHQGGLRLTTERRGVTATIVVPLAPGGRSNHGAVVNPFSSVTVRALRNERVLVVDDDPQVLRLVCATLEQAGYTVQAAHNVPEARSRLESPRTSPPSRMPGGGASEPFDLILTDVRMPEETGIDLIQGLQTRDPGLRFLIMTGRSEAEPVDLAPLAGAVPVLPKPFLPEQLLVAVRAALDRPIRPAGAGVRDVSRKR